jgi:PhnB protein
MTQIHCYLSFDGNCREAMTFYQSCLGGTLYLQTIGESPMAERLPAEMRDNIIHSSLINDNLVVLGSDMAANTGIVFGTSVSLMINCSSEAKIRSFYDSLSQHARASKPLEHTFWGALFGEVTDKYGVQWLFNFDTNQSTH